MSVHMIRAATALALLALAGCGDSAPQPTATAMNVDDFRRELVNLPLCGKPNTGPLAGKAMCTVHVADAPRPLPAAGWWRAGCGTPTAARSAAATSARRQASGAASVTSACPLVATATATASNSASAPARRRSNGGQIDFMEKSSAFAPI